MNNVIREIIKPLSRYPLQAYLDNRIQLFDIIEFILHETGPAVVMISTFSTSEEFLRRIYKLKSAGLITEASMIIDMKASRKIVNLSEFIYNVFDRCYLAENHSKVILIYNDSHYVAVCTSQNQTRGNRIESGMISTDIDIFNSLHSQFLNIVEQKSIKLNGLF